jgi:DsbC/DsbD-like thiol-disulfide interchange protein
MMATNQVNHDALSPLPRSARCALAAGAITAGFAAVALAAAGTSSSNAGALLVMQVGPPGSRQAEPQTAADAVKITLAVSSRQISPGETFHVAVQFKIHPHWHIYWKNSGAAGTGTLVKVHAPAGFSVGQTLFPRPAAFDEPEGTTFGYEKSATLFVPVTAPDTLTGETVPLKVTVDYLVCRSVCLIGRDEQTITVESLSAAAPPDADAKVAFTDSRLQALFDKLPRNIDDKTPDAKASFDNGTLTVVVPAGEARTATFFPNEQPGITFGQAHIAFDGGVATVQVPVQVKPGNSLGKPLIIAGLVALGEDSAGESFEFQLPPLPALEGT